MPETRILSTHVPHSTGINPYRPVHNPNQGPTAGAYVTASPGAGPQAQQYVNDTRQQMSVPPGYQPPGVTQSPRQGTTPQAAKVQLVDNRPSAGVIRVGASSGMADFSRPRVELINNRGPAAAGAGHAQVAAGGLPLALDEAMMVGFLANQFQETAAKNGDGINAELADRVLQKVHAYLQAQHAAAQVATPAQDQVILAQVEHAVGHPHQGAPQLFYQPPPPVQVAETAGGPQLIGPTTPPSVQVFPSRPGAPRAASAQVPVHVPPPPAYHAAPAPGYSTGLPWTPPAWMYPQAERVVVPPQPQETAPRSASGDGTATQASGASLEAPPASVEPAAQAS